MILWAMCGALVLAFVISYAATRVTSRIAIRTGMVDIPGGHKAHGRSVPLLGGSAIFIAVLLPAATVLALASMWASSGAPEWLDEALAQHIRGAASKVGVGMIILAGAAILHILGLMDDRKAMGAWRKLLVQLLVAACVAGFGNVRILTAIGPAGSVAVTILWLVTITNAFNFLDNMDGLSAGVAAICAAALLGASASMGQIFVSGLLCLLLGALLGFLPYNFPRAKVFMGDAGSTVIGFLLAVASCLTTYVQPGKTFYLYGAFVPLVLMAVPLYDMTSVIILRLREGRSPLVGDRRHLSHRLVGRGMKVPAAVMTIYLCTAATAISATLLANVSGNVPAILIFCQTMAIIFIVAVLESSDAG